MGSSFEQKAKDSPTLWSDGHIQLWKVSSATFVDIGQVYVKVKIRTPGDGLFWSPA
jgi:hypothetical protein